MASDKSEKRTASQRIDDLERTVGALAQVAENMARDLMTIKEAIKLLGNKLDSVAKASNLSDDTISKLMVENNVSELRNKVVDLVNQGILVSSDTMTDSSFVVGQELDEAGTVVNPRIQFTLGSLQPEMSAKIMAGKVGEAITLQEGKLRFMVTEIYNIVTPSTTEEASAPAAEQSSASTGTDSAPAQ